MGDRNTVYDLYKKLAQAHGDPINYWPQWCAQSKNLALREIVAFGAILVQRTSWTNAEMALQNLKKHKLLSIKSLSNLDNLQPLTQLIKPAGFTQTKPEKLVAFCKLVNNLGGLEKIKQINLNTLREKLLTIKGIGPETADTLLLYVFDKPCFIIDEYTKRFAKKHQLEGDLKKLFENSLPENIEIYQKYHALIIIDQKRNQGGMRVI